MWRGWMLVACASGFVAAAAVAADPAAELWVQDARLGAALLRVDAETGARTLVDLDQYPLVLRVGPGTVAPTGELYLEAVNAAQLSTIIRSEPDSGVSVGISG